MFRNLNFVRYSILPRIYPHFSGFVHRSEISIRAISFSRCFAALHFAILPLLFRVGGAAPDCVLSEGLQNAVPQFIFICPDEAKGRHRVE